MAHQFKFHILTSFFNLPKSEILVEYFKDLSPAFKKDKGTHCNNVFQFDKEKGNRFSKIKMNRQQFQRLKKTLILM